MLYVLFQHPPNCTDDLKINNIIPIKNRKKIKKANHDGLAFNKT